MEHIDDSFRVGYTHSACQQNIQGTVDCFDSLGFVIHPDKSVLVPTQELEFLGFLLNSISMTIRLPPSKAAHVKSSCENLLFRSKVTVRELAHVIGLIVSSLPGVQFGRLHYRQSEKDKSLALHLCKGNYDGPVTLSNDSRTELDWWVNNITSPFISAHYSGQKFTNALFMNWVLISFMPFHLDNTLPSEDRGGPVFRGSYRPSLAHTTMVSSTSSFIGGPPSPPTPIQKSTDAASRQHVSPIGKGSKTVGMSSLRQSILKRDFSEAATSIIMQSWSDSTHTYKLL